MKKNDKNLLLAAGVAGVVAWYAYSKKNAAGSTVSGIPGVGATLPNWSIVPEAWRGKASPVLADAVVWGAAGYGLAKYGKKFGL